MRRLATALLLITCVSLAGSAGAQEKPAKAAEGPVVVLTTSKGVIKLALDSRKAPLTTKNFLRYVDDGFYDGTIFHRVIPGFMIQGGGFTPDLRQKPTRSAVKNEAHNGLKNKRGTIAMARTGVVDSATAQFFINVADNASLDHRDKSRQGYGYAVFGEVIEGMQVVDAIVRVRTTTRRPHQNVPVDPVIIKSAKRE